MLFKNLVSGNIVSATNKTVIDLMKASPNYAAVEPKEPEKPAKKAAKSAKPTE